MNSKRIQKTVVLLILLFISSATYGQDLQSFNLRKGAWNLNFEVYSFAYEEPLMEETGTFAGMGIGYTYRDWIPPAYTEEALSDIKTMLRLEGRFAVGTVDYDGQYNDGTPFAYEGIDDGTFELRGLLGLDEFIFDKDVLSTLYLGLGFRGLSDEASIMPGGYDRHSRYLYMPIGCEFIIAAKKTWLTTANFEYDYFISGTQTSNLGDLGFGLNDIENKQKGGSGFRGSIRFEEKNNNFFIEPFFRLWSIEDSEIEYAGRGLYAYEPENTTEEYGISFGWKF